MKNLFVSLLTGALVGIIYTVANVRSPLPSLVVMVGFFGMYAGQQLPEMVTRWIGKADAAALPQSLYLSLQDEAAPSPARTESAAKTVPETAEILLSRP